MNMALLKSAGSAASIPTDEGASKGTNVQHRIRTGSHLRSGQYIATRTADAGAMRF